MTDNVEKLAEARWRADWTTDEGEISAIAPPFCQSMKEHYLNDARKVFATLAAAGLEVVEKQPKPTGRRRKPQDPTRWPPSMSQEDIESAIDRVCGCAGKYDCDCVSCFKCAGASFIVDEVQTGGGATGRMWAHEHWELPAGERPM